MALFQFLRLYKAERREARTPVCRPGFGKDGSSWVIQNFRGGGQLRATPWPPLLYRVANFQSPGLRKADLHLLKQSRKQEMSTVFCLTFLTSTFLNLHENKSATNGKLKTVTVTISCFGWRWMEWGRKCPPMATGTFLEENRQDKRELK